ncbi:leucine-rich repeat-containing protein 10 isoform X2 [Hyla sarda]|uniref:leucine-rich repeat-containing protein 10 isoform X2 n=1 Tax=Hyla sarda TaxID=327740 RepID=UPI0024C3FFE9|nr:leucine-rich repeat-containing protein 10 isoform X2 [Hyla sarda]
MGNTIRGIIAFIPSNTCQKYLLGDLEEMPIDKMVDLSSMQLRRFPLRTLHIGCNQIRNIPMELKNLVELRSIWMSGNLLTEFPPVLLQMPFLDIIDVDRNGIRFFPSLMHLTGLKLVIYDHNPCQNAPKVAKGVRRVGRWSEESPEPKKRFEVEAELEKAAEDKDTQPAESNEPPAASSDIPQEATSALTIKDN